MKRITLTLTLADNYPETPREVAKALDPVIHRLWRGDTAREGDTPLVYTWSVDTID